MTIDMKKSVRLSSYSLLISSISCVILCTLCFIKLQQGDLVLAAIPGIILLLLLLLTLFYMPLSISADNSGVHINRPLHRSTIPFDLICSVSLCPPTMAEQRIFGSGGWFGYWGWFKERDLGRYFAYYGRSSDCFLVSLKNGRKYMLGCSDPAEIVDFINTIKAS